MTEVQAIETIRQSYANVPETQIKLMLQTAVKEFCILTELLREKSTEVTQANVRYYPLTEFSGVTSTEDIVTIDRVDYDDIAIDHLAGEPNTEDLTEAQSS